MAEASLKIACFRLFGELLNTNLTESQLMTRVANECRCDRRVVAKYFDQYCDERADPKRQLEYVQNLSEAEDRLVKLFEVCMAKKDVKTGRSVLADLHRLQGLTPNNTVKIRKEEALKFEPEPENDEQENLSELTTEELLKRAQETQDREPGERISLEEADQFVGGNSG